jgi:hypothetical protein
LRRGKQLSVAQRPAQDGTSGTSAEPSPDAAISGEVTGGLDDDALEEPEEGFQVRSAGTVIEAGQDIEYCEIGEVPGDPSETYYVESIELMNADYSHHLVVLAAEPGSAADATLRNYEVGDKVVCNGRGLRRASMWSTPRRSITSRLRSASALAQCLGGDCGTQAECVLACEQELHDHSVG